MSQAWRDSNPQPPDLESGALANCATGLTKPLTMLPGFLVCSMLLTETAVFLILDSTGLIFLVLRRRIVPMLTNRTFQCYLITHLF